MGLSYCSIFNSTKQFTLFDAKIRFSGINFNDVLSSAFLVVKFNGITVPILYVKWECASRIPRVD